MQYSKIKPGKNLPEDIFVIVEIPVSSGPVKYEFNSELDSMIVDRFMQTSMEYPCNYGFIPHTLSGDGDPLDVLLHTNYPLIAKSIVCAKPIGVLVTQDEKGMDEKILAVPDEKTDPLFQEIKEYSDLPQIFIQKVEHFFRRYKDLEKGKWVEINGWQDSAYAKKIIINAVEKYKEIHE